MKDVNFNQMDSRWGNKLYSVIGDRKQTIAKSGCGPTSCAMLVSSFRDTIYPDMMANLLVENGHRTVGDGTAWSAFQYIAEKYGFDMFQTYNIDEAVETLIKGGMVIASCNAGLFSTGGHIILLNSMRDTKTITVYDPALYNGKYSINGRANKVWLEDNSVNVTIENIKNYGNVQAYFCFTDPTIKNEEIVYINTREQDVKDLKVSLCASFPDCDLDYSNGKLDEETRKAVERHTLSEGDENAFVNWFKDMLKSYAYNIEPNNFFDDYTANIVEEFQSGNGLTVDRKIKLVDVECLLDY